LPAPERSSPAEVRAALLRLRRSGKALRRQPLHERVQALGRVLERFRAPDSAERRQLERELPEATGFATATVREGLALALAEFSAVALEGLVEREIGTFGKGRLATGFDTTAVMLGGGVPTPTLLALAAPLLVGSPVLARTSSHDPLTARVFASALAAEAPALAEHLELVSFPSDDDAALRELLAASCVVAFGSDETMAALGTRLATTQRFVRHGHRLSVAVLGGTAQSGPALAQGAAALARDVALWDQQGCLSPVALYVLGVERVPDALLAALVAAFEDAAPRWPRGRVSVQASVRSVAERDTAELRAAAGADVRVRAGREFTLVAEPDAEFRGSPLYRFLRIHPVASAEQLLEALAPLGPHLAAVGVAGLAAELDALAPELAALGAARVCSLGTLQCPRLAWCHDQPGVLLPLARLTDID
jgi:acyl-CoA reductase-like NAD-dependent aldehyde dehydrogenase